MIGGMVFLARSFASRRDPIVNDEESCEQEVSVEDEVQVSLKLTQVRSTRG